MLIMNFEDGFVEIKAKPFDIKNMEITVYASDGIMTLRVPNSEFEQMIEEGFIDTLEEDDCCECPYCKIEEQIETLKLYLDESLSECDFEEIKNITESIKNLMEIREML